MANLTALKRYAQQADVTSLPASVLFSHTPSSLTIFDMYPKAKFHFLVIPRILSASLASPVVIDVDAEPTPVPFTAAQMSNLRILLKNDRSRVKGFLLKLGEDAKKLRM
jgi:aprataxin